MSWVSERYGSPASVGKSTNRANRRGQEHLWKSALFTLHQTLYVMVCVDGDASSRFCKYQPDSTPIMTAFCFIAIPYSSSTRPHSHSACSWKPPLKQFCIGNLAWVILVIRNTHKIYIIKVFVSYNVFVLYVAYYLYNLIASFISAFRYLMQLFQYTIYINYQYFLLISKKIIFLVIIICTIFIQKNCDANPLKIADTVNSLQVFFLYCIDFSFFTIYSKPL